MAREDHIEVEGTVGGVLSAALFRVELENGHRLLAFWAGKRPDESDRLSPGDKVLLQVSPFDLSKGRIVGKLGKKRDL